MVHIGRQCLNWSINCWFNLTYCRVIVVGDHLHLTKRGREFLSAAISSLNSLKAIDRRLEKVHNTLKNLLVLIRQDYLPSKVILYRQKLELK